MPEVKDITNITISSEASDIADSILEKGLFKDKADVLTFAAGYMIKNFYADFNPSTYTLSDSGGSNFASSTYDPERKWYTVICNLYNQTETPYLFLRALMDKGLISLGKRMRDDPAYSIITEV